VISVFVRDAGKKVFEELNVADLDLVGSVASEQQEVNAVFDLFFVDCSEVLYKSTS
jgi:hypothetical protein